MAWGAGAWTAIVLMALFASYGVWVVWYMIKLGTTTWFYSFQLLASIWLCVSTGLQLYVMVNDFGAPGGLVSALIPLASVAKGSSAMLVLCVWAWISAARVREHGVGNTWVLTLLLERSWPVFGVALLAAGSVVLYPEPMVQVDLESSGLLRAIAYRYLIAGPVSIFAAMMVVATIRFSRSQNGNDSLVRRRLQQFAVTWGCCTIWGFLWAGWIVPIGNGSRLVTVCVLFVGCVFGGMAMRPAPKESDTHLQINRFAEDQQRLTDNQYKIEGFSSEQFARDWPAMKDVLTRMSSFLPEYISDRQTKSALNSLWFLDSPDDRENAKNTHVYQDSALTGEFRPSIYGIPEECPFRAEIEEEIELHHGACWVTDILSVPNLLQRLQSDPAWVQITAVVAAYGNLFDEDTCARVLDREDPSVIEPIIACFHGLMFKDQER